MFPAADEYDIDISVDEQAVDALLSVTPQDVTTPAELTFSRNVFLPLTTACRYTCHYCTYYDVPGEATLMSPEEIRSVLQTGADAGCTEALFTFGDKPDDRYTEIHDQLDSWGYDSIIDYLYAACEIALEEGLLPHSNPGDLTQSEFRRLREVNVSMGVMLETTADVDAHAGNRRKTPGQRLNTIRAAGREGVPFTTGLLVGIGETWRDRAESLLAIAELHDRYGHIQEVIIQNVVPNERSSFDQPSVDTMRRIVAMARVAFPEEISVQVPPNLSPTRELIDCGVDDLGGVSPVTEDYINPDYAWPALDELQSIADDSGLPLYERLPVYDQYLSNSVRRDEVDPARRPPETAGEETDEGWLSTRLQDALTESSAAGRRYRGVAERAKPLTESSKEHPENR
ncbi:FO synthase subunit 1 [Halohasta litchfieldiae]|jgi:FO synthase subunit 1|uniref:7,8-didemethyl-8-hydroxy-5-deazariboflavin synthase n=1 Tax=Halohasta litchfieldiae TaxID=1073996 RepID=A0A1H6RFK5_9EURY|nr:7,8-didemethyl-8-hydroxy-5-deazariboflavin synthase subunit CofG [Halohasta litchfieldiae]ATW89756.1 FO synthase subunit 1 [Halohasta litchfieldiae]SEI53226.1 FO synthase subunit 1 [Halohasta litchfieldiae]